MQMVSYQLHVHPSRQTDTPHPTHTHEDTADTSGSNGFPRLPMASLPRTMQRVCQVALLSHSPQHQSNANRVLHADTHTHPRSRLLCRRRGKWREGGMQTTHIHRMDAVGWKAGGRHELGGIGTCGAWMST